MESYNRQILKLAFPSIVSNITVPLLGLVDQTIVGHLGAAAFIGAVAVGTMIFNVIYWIFGFLRMSTSGLASQALGRRDLQDVITIFIRSLFLGLAIALFFLIFQSPVRWLAVTVISPSATLMPLVHTYYNIVIWGAPAVFSLYAMTGWYVGMQNTKLPMMVSIIQVVANILLSLFFVFGLGMKIDGVALGTVLSQWVGFLMTMIFWFRSYRRLLRYRTSLRAVLKGAQLRKFFVVNRDIFLRTLFLVAVNLFFTAAGAREGDIILSVNALLMTFSTIFSYFMDGFAFAAEALCGRYKGAGNTTAFHAVVRALMVWGMLMTVIFSALYILGGQGFLSILTNNSDVLQAAARYRWWACLIPIAGFMAYIYDGIFIGITATRGMLISSAIAACSFFIVYFALNGIMGNHALWVAFLFFLAQRGIIQWLWMKRMGKSN